RQFSFKDEGVAASGPGIAFARGRWVRKTGHGGTETTDTVTFTLRQESGDWRIHYVASAGGAGAPGDGGWHSRDVCGLLSLMADASSVPPLPAPPTRSAAGPLAAAALVVADVLWGVPPSGPPTP